MTRKDLNDNKTLKERTLRMIKILVKLNVKLIARSLKMQFHYHRSGIHTGGYLSIMYLFDP